MTNQDIRREEVYSIADPAEHDLGELQELVREAWDDLRVDGTVANADARAAGIDVEALPQRMDGVLQLLPSAAGIVGVDVLVVGAGHVAWGLWQYVLLPQIRARWGDKALQARASREKAAARAQAAERKAAAPATKAAAGKSARKPSGASDD